MDSIVNILIIFLLFANFIVLFILLKRKQPEQNNAEQILKDQVNSLRNTFSESFGSMSKEIANSEKTCWFHWDLDRLANKIIECY